MTVYCHHADLCNQQLFIRKIPQQLKPDHQIIWSQLTTQNVQYTVIVDVVLVVLLSSSILLACGQVWRVCTMDISKFPEHVRIPLTSFHQCL